MDIYLKSKGSWYTIHILEVVVVRITITLNIYIRYSLLAALGGVRQWVALDSEDQVLCMGDTMNGIMSFYSFHFFKV